MAPKTGTKRLNFDVTPEQEAELSWLKDILGVSTNKDTVLRAVRVLGVISKATRHGAQIYLHTSDGRVERLVLPELEVVEPEWKFLTSRPHNWRSQLWLKGRRLLASTVWRDMLTNEMSAEEAVENWDLPLEAVQRRCRKPSGTRRPTGTSSTWRPTRSCRGSLTQESRLALRLLLDEDIQARLLVRLLREAGHDVLTVNEAGLQGSSDLEILMFALRETRVVLTRNPSDFQVLSTRVTDHVGIIGVYQHKDHTKNIGFRDIVSSLENVESMGIVLAGEFVSLNRYLFADVVHLGPFSRWFRLLPRTFWVGSYRECLWGRPRKVVARSLTSAST